MAMCIVTTIYLPALAARKLATQPAIGYVQGFIMPSAIRVPDFEYKAAAYEFYCPSWGTPIFASVLTLWSTIMSLQSIRPTHKEGCDPTTHFRPAIDAVSTDSKRSHTEAVHGIGITDPFLDSRTSFNTLEI